MKKRILFPALAFLLLLSAALPALAAEKGTQINPIQDSDLTLRQAIYKNQPPGTPKEILDDLTVVDVLYYSFDGKIHRGQAVIHKDLAQDLKQVFNLILESRFPVASVIPIAHPEIQKKGPYGLCPDTDNSSGYVFRKMVKGKKLSMHARGLAFDLNPRQNPYIRGDLILPPRAGYNLKAPGTLAPGGRVVMKFKSLGWTWGGDWNDLKDYMHFQKKTPQE